jgi:uncharacterized protein (DUF2384 family)
MTNPITVKIDSIQSYAGITGAEIAQMLSTTPETVSRWRVGKVQPQRKRLQQLLLLEWLTKELSDLYQPNEARIWLHSPNGMLDGNTPMDVIAEGPPSMERVLRIIEQLKDGAFA